MSAELVIFKNDVFLCDIIGGSSLFKLLNIGRTFPEEQTPFSPREVFQLAIDAAHDKLASLAEQKEIYEKVLNRVSSRDDIWEAVNDVKEIENEIADIHNAITILDFLLGSSEDDRYIGENLATWSWYCSY